MKGLFIPNITEGEIYDIDYEPERKKGKWIIKNKDSYACECSECKKVNVYAYIFDYDINGYRQQDWYCPNCGAKMEEA